MTLQLDSLIAIAFIVPVVFFVILNIVLYRSRGYVSAVKPVAEVAPKVETTGPVGAEAANDSTIREAA